MGQSWGGAENSSDVGAGLWVGLNPGLCIYSFEHTFEVYTEGERLYLFGLESADLAREWVKCIAKVGLVSRRAGGSPTGRVVGPPGRSHICQLPQDGGQPTQGRLSGPGPT